jgi:hypothetical protein
MAPGQGIDLAAAARSKFTPGPHDQRQSAQNDGGQHQGGGLGKDSYGGGGGRHLTILSGDAAW